MLHIERIVRIAPLMNEAERSALTEWAEDAVESIVPFDASNWPGWYGVARRSALETPGAELPGAAARCSAKPSLQVPPL